jgi:hypothetical protein
MSRTFITNLVVFIAHFAKSVNNISHTTKRSGAAWHCHRSAAVLSRSSTGLATLPECFENRPPAATLRLGTAALRLRSEG